jgi:hypothetical protein
VAVILLSIAAALEVATGIVLLVIPRSAGWLLLGADLAGAGIAVLRFTGIALLALGLGCAFGRHDSGRSASLAAMLAYNVLAAAYFVVLGIGGEFVGVLLWPVAIIHAVLAVLLARTWFGHQPADGPRHA